MKNLNQAAKQYYFSERGYDDFRKLYEVFSESYNEKYYEIIAINENLDKHDVQAAHEDALINSINQDYNKFTHLLKKSIKNNILDLQRKKSSNKRWNELPTDFEDINEKYIAYQEKETRTTEKRQLLRSLVRSANFGPKEKQTVELLKLIAEGQPVYQAAKQVGTSPRSAGRRLRKIADQYFEEKYGYLSDYMPA